MTILKLYSNKRLLLCSAEAQVFYKRGSLYVRTAPARTESFHSQIPFTAFYRLISKVPGMDRAFRLPPRCAAWIAPGVFVFASRGKVYRAEIENRSIYEEFTFPSGMSAPIYLSSVSGLTGFPDGIYCGTYTGKNCPVQIWNRTGEVWNEIYSFSPGAVLHVHNIIPDHQKDRLLVLTGDSDTQTGIWEARDGFRHMRKIAGGNQKYRVCFAFPEDGHLIFAMDAPSEQNYLYDMDEEMGTVAQLCQLPGSVINGARVILEGETKYLFSTAVEPDERLKGWRYLLSRKRADGIENDRSHVFLGTKTEGFREIASLKKDILPMGLFQFGNVLFPEGMDGKIFLCPQATKNAGKTMEVIL